MTIMHFCKMGDNSTNNHLQLQDNELIIMFRNSPFILIKYRYSEKLLTHNL